MVQAWAVGPHCWAGLPALPCNQDILFPPPVPGYLIGKMEMELAFLGCCALQSAYSLVFHTSTHKCECDCYVLQCSLLALPNTNSFDPHRNTERLVLLLIPFYK